MNGRARRLAGVGFAATALAATGLLGLSAASGHSGPALVPVSHGGSTFEEDYLAYEDYLRGRERYERATGDYGDRDRRDRGERRERHGRDDNTPRAWVDDYFFGLSPYQDGWLEGLIEGSDYGQDFVVGYDHPYHPLRNLPPGVNPDPSYRCTDPGGGTPYSCRQYGAAPPVLPGAPAPGGPAPGNPAPGAPAPGTPGPAGPGTPPATSNPGPTTTRPTSPTTSRPLVPPATPGAPGQPSAAGAEDDGTPLTTLLLVFLASAGSVGAGYLMLRRRGHNPLAGG
ncbi:MAG: hypothetical protein ACT4QF_14565 [Sporichthyaceae bacterium]